MVSYDFFFDISTVQRLLFVWEYPLQILLIKTFSIFDTDKHQSNDQAYHMIQMIMD